MSPRENAQAKENALHQRKTAIDKVAIVSKLAFLDNKPRTICMGFSFCIETDGGLWYNIGGRTERRLSVLNRNLTNIV